MASKKFWVDSPQINLRASAFGETHSLALEACLEEMPSAEQEALLTGSEAAFCVMHTEGPLRPRVFVVESERRFKITECD